MATRSEVLFYEEGHNNPIVFYQHWDGYELPHIVAEALVLAKEDGRLTDTPYLGRIIFSEMLRHKVDDTTGYGISFSRTEWTEYIVEVFAGPSGVSKITLDANGELSEHSVEEFIDSFLKPNGAFNWKKKAKEEVVVA
jgi:hypothetical protein